MNETNPSLRIGDVLSDNDPRCEGRTVRVRFVGDRYAVCLTEAGRTVKVRRDRIYLDNKPRRKGFSVRRAP